jgi:hypothetical protein
MPLLQDYREYWPVTDFIQARLKYTSEQARRRQVKAVTLAERDAAGRMRAALRGNEGS